MITISNEFFEQCVATATDATTEVFEQAQPHFDEEIEYLEDFVLGFETQQLADESLLGHCKMFVCLNAFSKLIPQLDLILTPTGFGVVRTDNLAPASPERVSSLQRALNDAASDALDRLLYTLVKKQPSNWGTSIQALSWIGSVLYTGIQLRNYGIRAGAHRNDLAALRPKIDEAEIMVMKLISHELFDELLEHVRLNDDSNEMNSLQLRVVEVIRLHLGGDEKMLHWRKRQLLSFVEDNLSAFSAYRDSDTYKANHYKPYENKQEDTTFFFGG